MALSIRRLNQSSFHDTNHHSSQGGVGAETVSPSSYGRYMEVGLSSGQTSSMAIHADFQGRYYHVFERALPSRNQHTVSSNAASSTSRSSNILPDAPCEGPSTSLSPRPSLRRLEIRQKPTAPERPLGLCGTASKRRRPIHDVDGPHTGTLGCKKRRLRRDLITSRLSRPFSSPATHILNREVAAGGKRFLKMAAAAAARKVTSVVIPKPPLTDWDLGEKVAAAQVATVVSANNIHPLAPAEMVRRAAILNRFRIRVCDEARQRGDRTDLEMTARAALLRVGTGLHGVGFVADPKMSQGLGSADARQDPRSQQTMSTWSTSSTTTSASRATVLLPIPSRRTDLPPPSHACTAHRLSPPGNTSKALRSLDLGCPSPRLRPLRSPELPDARNQGIEPVGDDEQLSFSATDYSDDFADPDDSEIYTDFSDIFGAGGSGAEEARVDEGRGSMDVDGLVGKHFEDYMDDLDGIPWDAR